MVTCLQSARHQPAGPQLSHGAVNPADILRRVSPSVVMLVEDHADTREMYAEVLVAAGFSTVDATNAQDALGKAAVLRPALIIADLGLGAGLDGLALCEKLKEDPDTKDIPMIVVTGWTADRKLRARADAAGCAAVLFKPVPPDTLVAVVRNVMQAQQAND